MLKPWPVSAIISSRQVFDSPSQEGHQDRQVPDNIANKKKVEITMTMNTPMLVTFCVYIFGMILIGLIAYLRTKNFDDYILGGRSLGSVVTALSAGASDMSGWLLMGLPGAIFI
jgi:hypothetical protein